MARTAVTAALVVASLLSPAFASAESSLQLGGKWYLTKRVVQGAGGLGLTAAQQAEDLNFDAGFAFSDENVFLLGLDLGYWSRGNESLFRLGLAPAVKHYFTDRNPGHITPYLQGELFAYLATGSHEGGSGFFDPYSPWGLSAAFGAEYNFSRNFSMGADLVGLRWARTSALQETDLTWYTTIHFSFRFFGLFQVYVKEDDREPQRLLGTPDVQETPPPPPAPSPRSEWTPPPPRPRAESRR